MKKEDLCYKINLAEILIQRLLDFAQDNNLPDDSEIWGLLEEYWGLEDHSKDA